MIVHRFMMGGDGLSNVTHREMVQAFERVLNEVKDEMKEKGREGEFIGARVSSLSYVYTDYKMMPDYSRSSIQRSGSSLAKSLNGIQKIVCN
jgi:adenosine deaminase CECR1